MKDEAGTPTCPLHPSSSDFIPFPRGPGMLLAHSSWTEIKDVLLMQVFAGLSLFSVFLLMALGLAIIFGQMKVINMAHGEFLTIGAYTTVFCSQFTLSHFPGLMPYYYPLA